MPTGRVGMRSALVPIVAGIIAGLIVSAFALRAIGAFAFAALPPGATSNCGTPSASNPYGLLAEHRPDVLHFYTSSGWNPLTQCRQIYDDWLAHSPDGGSPTTAPAFVAHAGWAAPGTPTARPYPPHGP